MPGAGKSNIPQEPKVENDPAPLVFPPGTPSWIVNALRRYQAEGSEMNLQSVERALINA